MELQQMRYAVAVAETLNFTQAARRCHVVQSALSHQIAKLERELGASLFVRSSRSVRLTPQGIAFVHSAREALAAAERVREEVASTKGRLSGSVTIGALPTTVALDLPAFVSGVLRANPGITVRILTKDSHRMIEDVRDGVLHLAFVGVPAGQRPPGVRSRLLARAPLVAIVPRDHWLAARGDSGPKQRPPALGLDELAGEKFIDFWAGSAGREQSDLAFADAGTARDVVVEASTAEQIVRFVCAGAGIALLPAAYADNLGSVSVVRLAVAPERDEYLIWRDRSPSPVTAELLRALEVTTEGGSPAFDAGEASS